MGKLKRYRIKGRLEAGCDEAGRGCLAGPVFAATVVIQRGVRLPGLDDSKKLSAEKRDILRTLIENRVAFWAVGMVDQYEIDEINILNASFLAMHRAIEQLHIKPELLLIDGNRFNPYPDIDHECIVKGDSKYASIAAASILAKTYRDAYMKEIGDAFPEFNWEVNKGYPTKDHRAAIAAHGPCEHHRRSFRLLPDTDKEG